MKVSMTHRSEKQARERGTKWWRACRRKERKRGGWVEEEKAKLKLKANILMSPRKGHYSGIRASIFPSLRVFMQVGDKGYICYQRREKKKSDQLVEELSMAHQGSQEAKIDRLIEGQVRLVDTMDLLALTLQKFHEPRLQNGKGSSSGVNTSQQPQGSTCGSTTRPTFILREEAILDGYKAFNRLAGIFRTTYRKQDNDVYGSCKSYEGASYMSTRLQEWPFLSRGIIKHKLQHRTFPNDGICIGHCVRKPHATSDEKSSTEAPLNSDSEVKKTSDKKFKEQEVRKGQFIALLTGAITIII
ncbi:hypothetical protein KI387_039854, partial [Taxus chinensis]